MKKILLVWLALTTVAFAGLAQPVGAAEDVFDDVCSQRGASDSVLCETGEDSSLTGSDGIIARITNAIAVISGILAVIIIIWGGFTYITSGGDTNKTTSARNMITYAVIGLIVIVLAQTLIAFVLSRL